MDAERPAARRLTGPLAVSLLLALTACAACHVPGGNSQTPQFPSLAGLHEEYLPAAMRQLRDSPGPGRDTIMAASLHGPSDADLADLAHYLAAFRP